MVQRTLGSRALALPLAVLAVLALVSATQAAALTWTTPLQLREHDFVYLSDAAFSGDNVAVVWQEYRRAALAVRTSDDGGATFGAMHRVPRGESGRVALCGDHVYLAYSHKGDGENYAVRFATGSAGTGSYETVTIADGLAAQGEPDVACNGQRVFVSWYESEGGEVHLYFKTALVSDMAFGARRLIASDQSEYVWGLQVAATNTDFYAAFGLASTQQIYLKRYSIRTGSGHGLIAHSTTVAAPGDKVHPAGGPVITASGTTVVLAFSKCAGIKVKVSHDRGQTWVHQTVADPYCHWIVEGGSGVSSVELNGDAIVMNWSSVGIPNYQASFISRTTDDFRTFTRELMGNHRTDHVGFIDTASGVRLADPFSRDDFVKFRRQN